MSEQNFIERLYFQNDIKGGLSNLLGQQVTERVGILDRISLPDYVSAEGNSLLTMSQTNEVSTGFFFEEEGWKRGKIFIGPKAKVTRNPSKFVIEFEGSAETEIESRLRLNFGKVPVIDFHTHPSKEVERLSFPEFKRLRPQEDERLSQIRAGRMRMSFSFPSSDDIVGMLIAQRLGASRLLMTPDSTILLVRTNVGVPFQELTKLVTGRLIGRKYDELIANNKEFFNRNVLTLTQEKLTISGIPRNIKQTYKQIFLRGLAEIGEEAGFVCYFNFDPRSKVLTRATKDLVALVE